jgi:NADH-quinone oxidoreductase subunit B
MDEVPMNARQEMDSLTTDTGSTSKAKPNVAFAKLSDLMKLASGGVIDWSRVNSLWPMQFGLACCAIELMSFGSPTTDSERKGFLLLRPTPRQCDVMLVAGWVTKSMIPEIKRMYEQMARPRYVIAFGECATCGGPWFESYNIVKGIDQVLPVDVYVAGCPPRPENLFSALMKLQKKLSGENEG